MEQLPDLAPWVDEAKGYLHGWNVQGDELRLTTAIANNGAGDLEIRGGEVNGSTQNVYQRIFDEDGSFTERLAGEFVYHSEHGHIHFEDFAEFRLRAVQADGSAGEVIAAGEKVSFCLIDVDRQDPSAGASQYRSCGQVQGISSGWADVYSSGLPGQSIDISGVANGTYFLEMVVDPLNRILESDETNNAERILINLDRPGAPDGVQPDAFERNDTIETASILAPPEDHVYENLTIHSGDTDFYRITAANDGTMVFHLDFEHDDGNLDTRLYDAHGTLIMESNRDGAHANPDHEHLQVDALAGEFFYVQVIGHDGATNANYDLSVEQGGHTHADIFEANDSLETAYVVSGTQDTAYASLTIHEAGDEDYFKITPDVSGTLSVTVTFDHSVGDVDLELLGSDGTVLARSVSTTDSESVSFEADADTAYFVRVYGYNDATNAYSMSIDVPEPTGVFIADIPNETQSVRGDPDVFETFVISASVADYGWGPTNDGTGHVVWGPTGYDILREVDAIQFDDEVIQLVSSDGTYFDIEGVTQQLTGETDNDVFVFAGRSEDYNWGSTTDGTGIVVWNDAGYDILREFETLRFSDTSIDISTTDDGELTVQNDPNRTQHLAGTSGVDTFVIDANIEDYGYGPTNDGQGIVVWQGENYDILRDFEQLQFNDGTVLI